VYGDPSDVPFVGDWDCDGVDSPGLYRRSTGQAFLRNSNISGTAERTFLFGNPGDLPLAGDFDGDGCDSLSIYRSADSSVHIINRLGSNGGGIGPADVTYVFGNPGDIPFAGDWDGDGSDSVGLHRPKTAMSYLRNSNSTGVADLAVPGSGSPVAGYFGVLPQPSPGPARVISMVPREGWGARPAITTGMVPHTITRLTVHHAGSQRTTTGPPQFRGWQDWHMVGQGWPDLAYHVIIGVDGTIYEGREPAYRGDTGTSYDTTGHFLIVVEGDFEIDHPTPAQLDSLAAVLAWASDHYDVPTGTISGHGDHAATLCPGKHLEAYLASGWLQGSAQALIDAGGVGLDWP
jgi:hypothetical protein